MTYEKLDGYLVLITFMLKKKKFYPLKNIKDFGLRKIFKKRKAQGIYNNLVQELRIGNRKFK